MTLLFLGQAPKFAPDIYSWRKNTMKKISIFGYSIVGILMHSPHSFADSDDLKYPATNFQPKVIYQDKELINAPSQNAEFDPKYPAANFQPQVLYIDKSRGTSTPDKKAKFDPKYPATNFEPKVIFPAG